MTISPEPTVSAASVGRPMLDQDSGLLSMNGRSVKLTKTEQTVLARLMRSDGQVVSRESLLDTLYNDRADGVQDKIIDVFVFKIRNKAASIGVTGLIETVWGRGWRVTSSAPRVALGLTRAEWLSLQVVVSLAARQNASAAEHIREAMHRAVA